MWSGIQLAAVIITIFLKKFKSKIETLIISLNIIILEKYSIIDVT